MSEPRDDNVGKCYKYAISMGRYDNLETLSQEQLLSEKQNTTANVRIVCISDTHSKAADLIENLPEGDILVHSGDFTFVSSEYEIREFNKFLKDISRKYKHIIVIAGNHDLSFDINKFDKSGVFIKFYRMYCCFSPFTKCPTAEVSKELLCDGVENCIYLQEESVVIMGIKFYGSPWQTSNFDLGFNAKRGNELMEKWNNIPNDTDILLTHGPPLGIGDKVRKFGKRVGCYALLKTIQDRVKPKYHIYGHIHEDYGIRRAENTIYINAAMPDAKYNMTHKPVVFDFIK